MFTHDSFLRVIYADTDQMGYVYYGNYAKFYEHGRTEMLRALGIVYKDIEKAGYMLPVFENYSKYLQPAVYDDLLRIKVTLMELPIVKWVVEYEIYNEENALIHTGRSVLIFMSSQTRKPCRVPEEISVKIRPHF